MSVFVHSHVLRSSALICLLVLVLFPVSVYGNDNEFSKENIVAMSNIIGAAAITTWGILNWDYFQNDPKKSEEKWFSDDTRNGGADKLGHFYFSYMFSHVLASTYENYGYSSRQGAALGAFSSLGLCTLMEIGDSFSTYGFSYEDCVMNLLGSLSGYVLYTHPKLSEKIDFRLEYRPDFSEMDFTTDYDHQKFLLAVKLDGFKFTQNNYLKYFELHLGYYTRGYPDRIDRERNIYAGIGINISRLFKQASMPKTSTVFNYIQLPYTYISAKKDLN